MAFAQDEHLDWDLLGAVVVEAGGYHLRCGFAGAGEPDEVLRTLYCLEGDTGLYSENYLTLPRAGREVMHPFSWTNTKADASINASALANLVAHTLSDRMKVQCYERPVLLVEPYGVSMRAREELVEALIEEMSMPAVSFVHDASACAYATGKSGACLVVDVGHRGTRVVPVYRGYVLERSAVASAWGGDVMTKNWEKYLTACKTELKPWHAVEKRTVGSSHTAFTVDNMSSLVPEEAARLKERVAAPQSYHSFARLQLIESIKEGLTYLADGGKSAQPKASWDLPDGTVLRVADTDRLLLGGLPFLNYHKKAETEGTAFIELESIQGGYQRPKISLPATVLHSMQLCEATLRPQLSANIILKGGGASYDGFASALEEELRKNIPSSAAIDITSGATGVGKFECQAWLGGSIMASSAAFAPHWVSKLDWEEHGPGILEKCQYS